MDQKGSKLRKIVQQLRGESDDEEEQDSNVEVEENNEINEDIKTELATKSVKEEGSTIVSEHMHGLHAAYPSSPNICTDYPKHNLAKCHHHQEG